MSWRYYITDSNNKRVKSEGGFATEELAHAVGGEYANKLASAKSSSHQVYSVTVGRDYIEADPAATK